MEKKLAILLADDHQLVRKGFRALLEELDFVEIAGEAANGQELIGLLRRGVKADLVLLDCEMPVLDGLETLALIKRDFFGLKVVLLTMLQNRELIQNAVAGGADGFLFKNASLEELREAVQRVAKGEKYFSSAVTLTLLQLAPAPGHSALQELTAREIEILKLVAQGFSSTEIGAQLYISPRTVDTHRNNLIQKLEVNGIAGLVQFALRHKLI